MAKKKQKHATVYGTDHQSPVCRVVFVHISHAHQFKEDSAPRFECNGVFNDGPRIQAILNDINGVAARAFGVDAIKGSDWAGGIRRPYSYGAEILERIDEPSEACIQLYTNRIVLAVATNESNDNPPACYLPGNALMPRRPGNDSDLESIRQQFYDGAFCELCFKPYSYVTGANKGVSLGWNAIRFYKDGPKLGRTDVDAIVKAAEPLEEGSWDDDGNFPDEPEVEGGQEELPNI